MKKKLLALYSLKYNPFSPEVPASALFLSPELENFCWRMETYTGEGGFAMVIGEPGTGKSAALRVVYERLQDLRDLTVGILTRPQATVADFYRELGHIFGVALSPHNRWHSAKNLREKWLSQIDTTLNRPVLIIDEAQEMRNAVFSELRMLSSTNLDSRSILSVIIAGDNRLTSRLYQPDLLPIASRIRARLHTEARSVAQMRECLAHLLEKAGNPRLMTAAVQNALSEHSTGNYRLMMNMANELLSMAVLKEADQIDEKIFFEAFNSGKASKKRKK